MEGRKQTEVYQKTGTLEKLENRDPRKTGKPGRQWDPRKTGKPGP